MTGGVVMPLGFMVQAAISPEVNSVSIVFDLPGAPAGLRLLLDAETALVMAADLQTSAAVVERAEHGRNDS